MKSKERVTIRARDELEREISAGNASSVGWMSYPPYDLPDEYDTDGPEMSLMECLNHSMIRIKSQYVVRAIKEKNMSFEAFWDDVTGVKFERHPKDQSGYVACQHELSPLDGPTAFWALYCAGVYWLDAKHELDTGKENRAWPALIRCNYFIGMACGPTTAKEIGSSGAEQASEDKDPYRAPLKAKFKTWLDQQPDAQAENVAAIIRAFAPIAEEFGESWKETSKELQKKYPKWNRWNASKVDVFLRGVYNDKNGEIRGLIQKKLKRPAARGRPPST